MRQLYSPVLVYMLLNTTVMNIVVGDYRGIPTRTAIPSARCITMTILRVVGLEQTTRTHDMQQTKETTMGLKPGTVPAVAPAPDRKPIQIPAPAEPVRAPREPVPA